MYTRDNPAMSAREAIPCRSAARQFASRGHYASFSPLRAADAGNPLPTASQAPHEAISISNYTNGKGYATGIKQDLLIWIIGHAIAVHVLQNHVDYKQLRAIAVAPQPFPAAGVRFRHGDAL
jgi:hypothetical protein